MTRSPTHEIARAGIGWVPDDRRLCPTLTVARNLTIAQKRTRFRAWSIKETCEIFSPLEYLMERECENLSGGEMQMVAIARALVGSPGLILFDEPSQGLAPKIVGDVLATIVGCESEGVASLIVEQNAEIALSVADHAAVIDRGRIAWTGDAADPARRRARCASACSEFTDGRAAARPRSACARSTRAAASSAGRPSRSKPISSSTSRRSSAWSGRTAPARPRCSR